VVADSGVIIGVGSGFTVIEVPAEFATQLSALVTSTVYVPVESTTIEGDVSPVLHKYAVPEFAVKVAVVSAQNVNGFNVDMVAVGFDTAIVIVPVEFEVPAVAVQV